MQITVYQKMDNPLQAIEVLGEVFTKSGMFGCDRTDQGKVLALACLAEQKNPFEIMRRYHLMNGGKLAMRSDAMLAEFKVIGGKCKWFSKLNDTKTAKAQFIFGENDLTEEYTIEDAQREGLTGRDNWKKSTPDMLRARLVSKVLRMIAPQIVAGVYAPEELQAGETVSTDEPLLKAEAPLPSEAKDVPAAAKTETVTEAEVVEIPEHTRKLSQICGQNAEAVNGFLRSKGWITPQQTYLDLTAKQAEPILGKPEAFVAKAVEWSKANVQN